MKARIAVLLVAVPEGGGIFQYALTVLEALAALDPAQYEVLALTRDRHWKKYLQNKKIREAPIPRFYYGKISDLLRKIPFAFLRDLLTQFWERLEPISLGAFLRRVDLVVVPHSSTVHFPERTGQIACIHDLMHIYEARFPEVGDPAITAERDSTHTAMLRQCDGIIVDSQTGKQHVLESYAMEADNGNKIFVLPYVIYKGVKTAVAIKPVALPKYLDGNYIFYPAQFWMHKNHQNLVAAAAKLIPRYDIHCVFSGDTHKNGYAPLCDLVEQLHIKDRIHHVGYVSEGELAWLYKHARCMIMPTFFGPTNIPPLEAMFFGCPVGVSNIYGIPEQLGDAPLYFDPYSVAEIAAVIEKLWTDEAVRDRCIKQGFAIAEAHSFEQFAQKLSAIIRTVLGRRQKNGTCRQLL